MLSSCRRNSDRLIVRSQGLAPFFFYKSFLSTLTAHNAFIIFHPHDWTLPKYPIIQQVVATVCFVYLIRKKEIDCFQTVLVWGFDWNRLMDWYLRVPAIDLYYFLYLGLSNGGVQVVPYEAYSYFNEERTVLSRNLVINAARSIRFNISSRKY